MRNARKIARKLRDDRLAKCIGRCEKPNEIKGFREVGVTNPSGFQDRLVMAASITLHNYDAQLCIIIMELKRSGSASLLDESASNTPPEDRQARLSGAGGGYLR